MRKTYLILGLLVTISMILSACGPAVAPEAPAAEAPAAEAPAAEAGTTGPAMKEADTLVFLSIGDPETFDPSWTYETTGSALQSNVYEGPIWFDREKTDSFVPVLATDWSVDDSGTVYTFTIREGVTFHAGGTLEAHDVAYSFQRGLLQDRIDGPHWMSHDAFFGTSTMEDTALTVATGKEALADLSEQELVAACELVTSAVVADDAARTVTYTLRAPTPWFLAMLAQPFLGATYDQEWMAEQGDWDGSCDNWLPFHDPAAEDSILFNQANGTGPYKLDHWTPTEEIVLTANENYWRAEGDPIWEGGPSGVAKVKTFILKPVDEWGTRLAQLEAGDADWIYAPNQYYAQMEDLTGTTCQADGTCEGGGPGWVQAWIGLPEPAMTPAQFNWNINVEGGSPFVGSGALDGSGIPADFFSDIHVRKAFNYCFDFDAMVTDALGGEGFQAQGPIIKGMMGYREGEDPLYSYDPAKCEEEFKLADVDKDGIPAGEDEDDVWNTGFYFQIGYNTGNDTRRLASEILKAGIEGANEKFSIAVVGMPWPVLLNSRRAQKLPIYVGGWLEDFHDPHNWVHPFLHSDGAYGRVINMPPELAAEYDAAIAEAASFSDTEVRRPLYEALQLKAQEDAVVIWMYQAIVRDYFQPWVKGWYYNPAYPEETYTYIYALSKGE
jgi:peptide/nickel transport system substrate-binding protein